MKVEDGVDVDDDGKLPPPRGNKDFIIVLCTPSRPLRCRPAGTQDPQAKQSAHRTKALARSLSRPDSR